MTRLRPDGAGSIREVDARLSMQRRKASVELGELLSLGMDTLGTKQPVPRLAVPCQANQDMRAADPRVHKTRVEIDGTFVLSQRRLELP